MLLSGLDVCGEVVSDESGCSEDSAEAQGWVRRGLHNEGVFWVKSALENVYFRKSV